MSEPNPRTWPQAPRTPPRTAPAANSNGGTHRTTRDLAAELAREAEQGWPESWRPKPGDTLVGTLLRYNEAPDKFHEGGTVHVATVRVEATAEHGEYLTAVWLGATALLREFKRLRPKPGERIGIRRLPDREKGDGTKYGHYLVKVDRPGELEGPAWDSIEVAGDE